MVSSDIINFCCAVRTRPANNNRKECPPSGEGLGPVCVLLHHSLGQEGHQGKRSSGSPPRGRLVGFVPQDQKLLEQRLLLTMEANKRRKEISHQLTCCVSNELIQFCIVSPLSCYIYYHIIYYQMCEQTSKSEN